MIRVVHQPAEQTNVPLGIVAVGAGSVVIEDRATVPPGTALAAMAEVAVGKSVVLRIFGGTDGESYLLTVPLTLADGQLREVEVEVVCVDGRWAMPGGGAAMLSIAEFVDAVGLDEAIRLTDPNGSGRIDAQILTGPLVAAQGQVEAALGGRYRLPLAVVPQALKTAIVDLARLRLYPGEAPDGVKTAAANSTRYLDRVASGQATLPVTAAPAEAQAADPVLIRPGTSAYPDKLAGFGF